MAAGLVNNTMRQLMADTRSFYESGGWCDLGHVPTFVSATSFTIPTDVTAFYGVGRRIRMYGAIMGTLFGYITASTYSAPNTTVTVTLDSGSLTSNLSNVLLAFTDFQAQAIADFAITSNKLATNSVTTTKVLDAQITKAKLGFSTISNIAVQVFTSSGTYTPNAAMLFCIVEAVGGGGGGGGVSTSTSTTGRGGGGGGGAGYCRRFLSRADVIPSQVVTIGANGGGGGVGGNGGDGGTTSFGSILTATGGLGGAAGGFGVPTLGGSPGSFTGGDFGLTGSFGGSGIAVANTNWGAKGGDGGSSFLGLGGVGLYVAGGFGARVGTGRGAGGSGAATSQGATSSVGADGTSGIIIITEFLS
jgi:hypothetical protein